MAYIYKAFNSGMLQIVLCDLLIKKLRKMTYKEVKIWIKALVLILAVPFFNSCGSSDEDLIGNWVGLSDFDGIPRTDAVGFSIGNKGYIGTGYDGDERRVDFWEYDITRNTWTQKADLPGVARNGAIGFGIRKKLPESEIAKVVFFAWQRCHRLLPGPQTIPRNPRKSMPSLRRSFEGNQVIISSRAKELYGG